MDHEPFELPTAWTPDEPRSRCRFCRGAVDAKAVKCKHCGEWLAENAGFDTFAAILSFLIVGLGQVTQLRILHGLLFFLGAVGFGLSIWPIGLIIYAWAIFDAGDYPRRAIRSRPSEARHIAVSSDIGRVLVIVAFAVGAYVLYLASKP